MYVIRVSNGRTAAIVQGGASAYLLMAIGNSYTRYFATIDLRVPNVSWAHGHGLLDYCSFSSSSTDDPKLTLTFLRRRRDITASSSFLEMVLSKTLIVSHF